VGRFDQRDISVYAAACLCACGRDIRPVQPDRVFFNAVCAVYEMNRGAVIVVRFPLESVFTSSVLSLTDPSEELISVMTPPYMLPYA
jgi:hypothetical protein